MVSAKLAGHEDLQGEPGNSEVPLTTYVRKTPFLGCTKNLNLDHHYRDHRQIYMVTSTKIFVMLQRTTVMDEPMKVSN